MKHLWLKLGVFVLCLAPAAAGADVLVGKGAVWSYLDNGSDQGTAWRSTAFNDSGWKTGPAQLGYGDGDEATVVSYGSNSSAKYITTYFRRHFSVTNPAAFVSLTLNLKRDDGAVVYLNGVEVHRGNMPTGAVGYTTRATSALSGADETTFFPSSLSTAQLAAGDNVIAVEIHQSDPASSDISFDLELLGNTSVSVTRGPYLQMAAPNGVTVRWRTDAATNSRVRFGTSQGALTLTADDAASTTEHVVRLTGLTAETRYYYSVGSTTATLAGGDSATFFETSPPAGTARPTRVWVIGDSGTANADAAAVYNAYRTFTGSTYTDLWLMLGDNAYEDGTDAQYQAAVFNMYPALLRQSPLWPTLGNHDGHTANSALQSGPYYDIFTLPKNAEAGGVASGTEAYYSFDYSNIHFVVLDSYETDRSTTGAMMTWLKADLQATTADWLIAFWHHPPYSKGSHDSDVDTELKEMRQNFLPVLEENGVDLVLTGHSHAYERSKLIDGHYGLSGTFNPTTNVIDGGSGRVDGTGAYSKATGGAPHDGAVYVVAGSSGQTSGGALNHPAMYLSLDELGSMVLDVDGLTLNAKFLNNNGTTRDYFTIVKSGSPPLNTTVDLQNGLNGYSGNDDSYVASGQPGVNFGGSASLLADGSDGTNGRLMSVLKWNVSSIPATAVVESARLTLDVFNPSAGAYNVYALNAGWSESTVTWTSLSPTTNLGTLIGTLPANSGTGARQINLNSAGVALVQGWINGTAANNGVIIVDAGTSDGIDVRSSEYTTVASRPKLIVTYH
jgi:Calcineurin-like phosphoesterase/Purple acid Phosphatase, N-terminal domain